jgi:type VI secretion system secreted protein VgrG
MGAQDLLTAISGGLIQTGRLLKLDTSLGDTVLLPQRVIGRSRIGRDYSFTLDAVSTTNNLELKTLIAQPVTLWLQQTDQSYLPFHGYVHTARRLGADGGLTAYQLEFTSWLHFLKFRKDARIWQDESADAILADVFNAHPQAQGGFRFVIQNVLPQRSFCVQYESDWNFCQRIMESEGLFSYFEQAADGKSHTLIVTDNIGSLPALNPQTVNFYRSGVNSETDSFVHWSGTRTLQSVTLTTSTFDYKSPSTTANPKGTTVPTLATQGALPQQTEVYEYTGAYTYGHQSRGDALSDIRMQEWESRAKRFEGSGAVRRLDAGRWFELVDHPEHDTESQENRQFAIVEAEWYIENNLPVSTAQTQTFPYSLAAELGTMKAAHQGKSGALTIRAGDGGEGFLLVKIEAQRRKKIIVKLIACVGFIAASVISGLFLSHLPDLIPCGNVIDVFPCSNMPYPVDMFIRFCLSIAGLGDLVNPDDMEALAALFYWLVATLMAGVLIHLGSRALQRYLARKR